MIDRPTTRQFRILPLLTAGLAVLVVLLVAEAILRTEAGGSLVRAPDLYYQPGVQKRLDALGEVQQEYGDIDLLFVGSSVVRTDFRPLVFDGRIAEVTGLEVVSFNGGLSDLYPDPVLLYLENFWFDHSAPQVVVQGVRYNEVRANVTAEGFGRFQDGRLEKRWLRGGPVADIEAAAMQASALFQHSGALTQALTDAASATTRNSGFSIDERGYSRTFLTLAEARDSRPIDQIPGSDAAIGGYADPLRAEDYAFGLGVLERTLDFVESHGAVYVLVNMPEHADKFLPRPDGQERYAYYIDQLASFAQSNGILFYDPSDGRADTFASDAPFSDFHHLNPDGAEDFSAGLADFVASHADELLRFTRGGHSPGEASSR